MKKSICLFSSFFVSNEIPYYVKYYVTELRKHFDEFIFITNSKELNSDSSEFLSGIKIQYMPVSNEGFDFGMWYKGLKTIETSDYNQIALINDSCILFKSLDSVFDKINRSQASYIGMLQSNRYSPHLQSFFLIVKQKAIAPMVDYFNQHGLVKEYREIIQTYEIGLSKHMLANGIQIEGLYNKGHEDHEKNPSFDRITELIEEGIPLIKKKIVYRNFRGLEFYWIVRMNFNTDYRKHFKQIKNKYGVQNVISISEVMKDAPIKHHRDIFWFTFFQGLANFMRKIPFARSIFHFIISTIKKIKG